MSRTNYDKVWVWQENGAWTYKFGGRGHYHDGYPSYEDAVQAAEGEKIAALNLPGSCNLVVNPYAPDGSRENRSHSASKASPVSAHQTKNESAPAPLKTDSETYPVDTPVVRILNVELDLIPVLKELLETEIRRTVNGIQNKHGIDLLSGYEQDAVQAARAHRMVALNKLLDQIRE